MSTFPKLLLCLAAASVSCRSADWDAAYTFIDPEIRRVAAEERATRARLARLGEAQFSQTCVELGYQHRRVVEPPREPPWVQLDLGETVAVDCLAIVPVLIGWQGAERKSYGFPRRFRLETSNDGKFFALLRSGNFSGRETEDPGALPIVIDTPGVHARYVRLTVTQMAEDNGRHYFALGEIMVISGFRNVAIGCAVKTSSSAEIPPRWRASNLVDGRSHLGPPIKEAFPQFDGYYVGPTTTTDAHRIRLDLGHDVKLQQVVLHPIHARLGADVPGYGFPERLTIAAGGSPASGADVVYRLPTGFTNPGNNPVVVPLDGLVARYLELSLSLAARPTTPQRLGFSEIEVFSEGVNIAGGARIDLDPEPPAISNRGSPGILVDGFASSGRILPPLEWLAECQELARLQKRLKVLGAKRERLEREARGKALTLLGGAVIFGMLATTGYLWRQRVSRRRELEQIRVQLARDLHDEIGSNLAGLSILSELAAERTMALRDQQTEWRKVHRIARDTTQAMREVMWVVGAREESGVDLPVQLRLAADRLLFGREVIWQCDGTELPWSWTGESRRHTFLFFKEVLANALRHSGATRYEISIRSSPEKFELSVRDNGRGFWAEKEGGGMGLPSLRARARSLGGHCAIHSVVGQGTLVSLIVHAPVYPTLLRRTAVN